jgi:hypothetical protein
LVITGGELVIIDAVTRLRALDEKSLKMSHFQTVWLPALYKKKSRMLVPNVCLGNIKRYEQEEKKRLRKSRAEADL